MFGLVTLLDRILVSFCVVILDDDPGSPSSYSNITSEALATYAMTLFSIISFLMGLKPQLYAFHLPHS